MTDFDIADPDEIFRALGKLLEGEYPLFLVIVGGSVMRARHLSSRATRDVDVIGMAIQAGSGLIIYRIRDWPEALLNAVERIARDFRLRPDWLNSDVLNVVNSLPPGFAGRLEVRDYGASLKVGFASRLDLIHLKLLASLDGDPKHQEDLVKLNPEPREIKQAVQWIISLASFRNRSTELHRVLVRIGYDYEFG